MGKPPSSEVVAGREAVETYRADHTMLYTEGWYKGVSEDHTPLLNQLLTALEAQGFSTLAEFFDASEAVGDEWQ